jgi:hypothetical protein
VGGSGAKQQRDKGIFYFKKANLIADEMAQKKTAEHACAVRRLINPKKPNENWDEDKRTQFPLASIFKSFFQKN